jgi:hypothetical protein
MSAVRSPAGRAVAVCAGVVLVQALLVLWFAWPARNTAPRDLPVVVAGPAPAAAAFADRLRAERPGAFDITTMPDAAAADAALRGRDAYAAFVLGTGGPSLHVASAAGPAVATLMSQAAQQLGGGQAVPVVDVVASPADDPRGGGFAAGLLPIVLTGLIAGAGLIFAVRSLAARLAGVVGYAVLAGAATGAIEHATGVLTGEYLADAGALALLSLAVSASVAGLGALLGRAGVALGVLLVFLFGNPISGLTAAPELLPTPWGRIGQLLPPGAGASLLRSVAFFDGAAAAGPLWVLGTWALAGLVMLVVGGLVTSRRRPDPGSDPREAAARLGAASTA